jgi:hypothetical protein
MDSGVLLACALLLGGCAYYIVRPLRTLRNVAAGSVNERQLNERKEQLYASILELEFDRELGKLPEADFQHMRGELESQALAILEQLDQTETEVPGESIEERIEREVAALHDGAHTAQPAVPPQPVPEPDPSAAAQGPTSAPAKFCGQCGTARRGTDRFCTQCGTAFEKVA